MSGDSQQLEIVRRYGGARNALRFTCTGSEDRTPRTRRGKPRDCPRLRSPIGEVGWRDRKTVEVPGSARLPDLNEAAGIPVRQRFEQHAVDGAEDRRARTDSQS